MRYYKQEDHLPVKGVIYIRQEHCPNFGLSGVYVERNIEWHSTSYKLQIIFFLLMEIFRRRSDQASAVQIGDLNLFFCQLMFRNYFQTKVERIALQKHRKDWYR